MYASNTVVHMLTEHAYARAIRAHIISSAAIVSILLETPGCMSEINLDKLRIMHQGLLKGDISTNSVVNEECVQQITNTIDNLEDDIATKSRTAKMWMNYVKCVSVIRLFMRVERTGDWNLHLYCISEMIPDSSVSCSRPLCICEICSIVLATNGQFGTTDATGS